MISATPDVAFYIPAYDGAQRMIHPEPPVAELERGPIWVIDMFHGHREFSADRGSFATADGETALVLYDERELVSIIPAREILSYETVTVLDPDFPGRYGPLWSELEFGNQVTLIEIDTGVRH